MTFEVSASVPKWYVKKAKSRSLIFVICSHAHQFHVLVLSYSSYVDKENQDALVCKL